MCLYPKLINNKKYTPNKKNGGNVPPVTDKRVLLVPVGCGKCMECKKQKAQQWRVRLLEEIKEGKQAEFVTLTFSNEEYTKLYREIWFEDWGGKTEYEMENAIATLATRRFLERWRKKTKKSVKHWLITELGHNGTENIHLHGIIWTDTKQRITDTWNYGYIYIGDYVNEETVNYIVKYAMKVDEMHREYNGKILASKGIGREYTKQYEAQKNKYKEGKTKEHYTTREGRKMNMPIYYRNKIYTEEEREKLWVEKIDQNKRYIDGVEIKADDSEAYNAQLKIARAKNKQLGYGDDEKNWERIEYENARKGLMQDARMK